MKINKILFAVIAILSAVSCDTSDFENSFDGASYVFFEVENESVSEAPITGATASGDLYVRNKVVEVIFNRSIATSELTVEFSTSATYATDSDFFNEGDDASDAFIITNTGSVTFPAGDYKVSVPVVVIDDLTSSGTKNLELVITGVSDNTSIGVPNGAIPRESYTLAVSDDDCPINLAEDWAGEYTITDVAPAGSTNDGLSLGGLGFYSGNIELTPDPDDPAGITALLSNAEGGSFLPAEGVSFVFDTCPELIIAGGDVPLGFAVSGTPAFIGDSGREQSFDPDSFTITVNGNLINSGGTNFGEWDFSFTKN